MSKAWTIIVLLSFLVVLFGSFFMTAHGSSHGFVCLATKLNGSEVPCPVADPLGFATFHGEALRKFSNLIVIDGLAILYVLIFALSLSVLLGLLKFYKFSVEKIGFYRPTLLIIGYPLSSILAWFSLHENSPSYI